MVHDLQRGFTLTKNDYFIWKDWIELRSHYGEHITGIRGLWETSDKPVISYGAKFGLATNPKKLKSSGVKRLIEHV